jgi:uncharacterized protein (TIGR02246 family)
MPAWAIHGLQFNGHKLNDEPMYTSLLFGEWRSKSLVVFTIILVMAGCTRHDSGSATHNHSDSAYQADIDAITLISNERAEAFRQGDAQGISIHFATDGMIIPPGSPVKTGREAIEAYYQEIFDNFDRELNSYYEEVLVSGRMAVGRGVAVVTVVSREDGTTTTSTSRYINVLKKQEDNTWITTHDIWNPEE